ncbi:protein CNGC15b-like [Nymphaea colorata]|nr:protein CNGC15b-like [Nymphaea colorata]XP_031473780.1 protein CNGC15b-like [Nymphaea colorata]
MMTLQSSKSVRFQDDPEVADLTRCKSDSMVKLTFRIDGTQIPVSCPKKVDQQVPKISDQQGLKSSGKSLKSKVLSRVFSEDYERVKRKILDPRGTLLQRWNKVFLVACLISLFVDPLFFYLPGTEGACIEIDTALEIVLTIVRSIADMFYVIHIFIRFRTAYIAPSSRVFGRGELVIEPSKIASRYLQKEFWVDLIAALPLPQVLIWVAIPSSNGSTLANTKNVLRFIIIFQYLPRLFLIVPLSSQIVKTTGVVTETAWAGAAYNLMLYMLASHVLGASWYLLAIERDVSCWEKVCNAQGPCQYRFLDCRRMDKSMEALRQSWVQSSKVTLLCSPNSNFYEYGIYGDALNSGATSSKFFNKYFYCLWWGLQNLSCLGQNLQTSTFVGEISFAILIAVLGLVLFALLIGNMQTYLQSTTVRLEEWRIKRTDTEEWMRHRQLPPDLKQCVRKYDQYKWVATRGVDEEAILKGLPVDLRRDIKRHLCLDLVRRVPLFDQMDDQMLDAICERLKPALCTNGTCLVREGDPVNEMLFVIRGHLDSYTTNGGRTGFFNSCRLGPGDFCGEELLTWALDPRPSVILPSSTRTVRALVEVEAFALRADDLKFVAAQFRRLHSKQLQHTFRFYSHQWRTWAACFIQAAWRRFKRHRAVAELQRLESPGSADSDTPNQPETPALGIAVRAAARLAASARWSAVAFGGGASESSSGGVVAVQKPKDPDFSVEEEDE